MVATGLSFSSTVAPAQALRSTVPCAHKLSSVVARGCLCSTENLAQKDNHREYSGSRQRGPLIFVLEEALTLQRRFVITQTVHNRSQAQAKIGPAKHINTLSGHCRKGDHNNCTKRTCPCEICGGIPHGPVHTKASSIQR
jgi:hypothetical protein